MEVKMVKDKLLDRLSYVIRVRHLSYRTEEAYLNRIKKSIMFHNKRHPIEMRETEVGQFLTYLAVKKKNHSRDVVKGPGYLRGHRAEIA